MIKLTIMIRNSNALGGLIVAGAAEQKNADALEKRVAQEFMDKLEETAKAAAEEHEKKAAAQAKQPTGGYRFQKGSHFSLS